MSDLPPPPGPPPPPQPGWGQQPPPGWGPPSGPPPGSWGQQPPPPPPGAWGQQYSYGYPAPSPPRASFWARVGALLLDGLIVGALGIPGWVVIGAGPKHLESCTVDSGPGLCKVPDTSVVVVALLLWLAALVIGVGYYAVLDGRGQTLGRRAVGIRVVDAGTGLPIGVGRALGRTLFRGFISGSFCGLGYLWMLWDQNKQTWHDKVVSSIVVPASAVPSAAAAPSAPSGYAPPAPPWS